MAMSRRLLQRPFRQEALLAPAAAVGLERRLTDDEHEDVLDHDVRQFTRDAALHDRAVHQLDSNAPNDPKIRSVLKKFGNEGFGTLIRLWCFVAAHGTKKPGWSLDSSGKPIDKAVLVDAAGTSEKKFDDLLREITLNGHVKKIPYLKRGVIVFPAMCRRADPYTRSQLRTNYAVTAQKLRVHNSTEHTKNKTPLPPFAKGGRITRQALKAAENRRARVYGGCPHTPRCDSYAECVALLAQDGKVRA
jgi:hypothetical protein